MHVTLFWEKRSMRELLRKNLMSHRPRNKLTSIIYSLTLGCIIFLLVTATLELSEITAINTLADADIVVKGKDQFSVPSHEQRWNFLYPIQVEEVLLQYKDDIKDFAWVTGELHNAQTSKASSQVSDYSRLEVSGTAV